jgi:hypothetical protein
MFKKLLDKTRGKLTYGSIAALAALALGVEIGPEEVTNIAAGVLTLTAIYGRWRATR